MAGCKQLCPSPSSLSHDTRQTGMAGAGYFVLPLKFRPHFTWSYSLISSLSAQESPLKSRFYTICLLLAMKTCSLTLFSILPPHPSLRIGVFPASYLFSCLFVRGDELFVTVPDELKFFLFAYLSKSNHWPWTDTFIKPKPCVKPFRHCRIPDKTKSGEGFLQRHQHLTWSKGNNGGGL